MKSVIAKDGMNYEVIVDRDRPIHISKTRASVQCGLIVTPTMKTSLYEQPKVLDNVCEDCQQAVKETQKMATELSVSEMVYVPPTGTKYHRVLHPNMTGDLMPLVEADALLVERDGKWLELSPCRNKPCFPLKVS